MQEQTKTELFEILRYPSPALKKPSEPVTDFDGDLAAFVEKLYRTMRVKDGVGLAASQVGVLKRVAVVEYEGKSYVLINPRVLEQRGEQEAEEGCLSFPGLYAMVKRPEWAKIEAQDEKGETHIHEVSGYVARAFLHEMDHMDGRLFIDHLSPLKRGAIAKKMRKGTAGASARRSPSPSGRVKTRDRKEAKPLSQREAKPLSQREAR